MQSSVYREQEIREQEMRENAQNDISLESQVQFEKSQPLSGTGWTGWTGGTHGCPGLIKTPSLVAGAGRCTVPGAHPHRPHPNLPFHIGGTIAPHSPSLSQTRSTLLQTPIPSFVFCLSLLAIFAALHAAHPHSFSTVSLLLSRQTSSEHSFIIHFHLCPLTLNCL